MGGCADAEVAKHANVIHSPVGFNKIIMHVDDEVVIDINRDEHPVPRQYLLERILVWMSIWRIAIRNPIGCMVYAVMKISHIIMTYHVTSSGDLDRIF